MFTISDQIGKQYELLNCDRHKHLMKKLKKDISACRPDIVHQVSKICTFKFALNAGFPLEISTAFICAVSAGPTSNAARHINFLSQNGLQFAKLMMRFETCPAYNYAIWPL